MKRPLKILILVVVVLFILNVAKNSIAKSVFTGTLSRVTHVPVKVDSVRLSFLTASIRIKNLQIFNPSGFPDRIMVSIPQIFIDFEPSALLKGHARFKELRLDLREMTVVRDKNGRLNVDSVKPTKEQKNEAKQKAKNPSTGKAPKLLIEKLYLSIGRVVYKDYSRGAAPVVQTFDINIKDREYTNIDNPAAIVSLVMFEALTRTTLSSLANLDLDAFQEGGLDALSKGLGLASDGSDVVQNSAKQLLNFLN